MMINDGSSTACPGASCNDAVRYLRQLVANTIAQERILCIDGTTSTDASVISWSQNAGQ